VSAISHLTRKNKFLMIGTASHSQTLVLMRVFEHPHNCWKNYTTEHKQSRRFLESVDENFFLQVIEEPTRTSALLDLILAKKEGLIEDVKTKDSLGYNDCEMMEFRILREWSKVKSKLTNFNYRKADFGLFKYLLSRVPWDVALGGEEAYKSWLIFKNHCLKE